MIFPAPDTISSQTSSVIFHLIHLSPQLFCVVLVVVVVRVVVVVVLMVLCCVASSIVVGNDFVGCIYVHVIVVGARMIVFCGGC